MSDQDTTLLEPVDGGARSGTLMVLLGLLVALALAGGGYWLLLGPGSGDGDAAADAPPVSPPPAATDVEADEASLDLADTATEEATVTALPTVTYEVFLSRDPFDPVVPEDVEPVSETSELDEGQDQTEPTDPDGDDPDGDSPVMTPVEEGCRGDTEVVCNGRVVTVVGFTTEGGQTLAVIQVDTTIYEVKEGDQFATNFEVIALEPPYARLRFGDVVFVLAEGDTVLK